MKGVNKMVTVIFPSLISRITKEKQIEVAAKTLGEALDILVKKYGDSFKKIFFNESGDINRFLNFYINGKKIISYNKMEVILMEEDKLNILIIITGG